MRNCIYSLAFLLLGCQQAPEVYEAPKGIVVTLPEQVVSPLNCDVVCATECEKEVQEEVYCKQEVACVIE